MRLIRLAAITALFLPLGAQAADKHWTGATGNAWNVNGNWLGNAPGSGDNAIFDGTFTNQPTLVTSANSGPVWMTGAIAQDVTIQGSGTLAIQSGNAGATNGLGILVDNANAFQLTINANLQLQNAQTWTNNSSNLVTIAGNVDIFNKTLTFNTGNFLVSGVISNSSTTLTIAGSGTRTFTGANTYTAATVVSGGTLTLASSSGSAAGSTASITVNAGGTVLLGASNQINNAAPMALAGGTFAKGNFSEGTTTAAGVGALTLTAAGSHIDFGTGTVGVLTFVSLTPGAFTLAIDNWTGTGNTVGITGSTDRLVFAADQSANLSKFNFAGYLPGAVEFNLGGGFWEVVPVTPVPEPSTWLAAALAFGTVGFHFLRRPGTKGQPSGTT